MDGHPPGIYSVYCTLSLRLYRRLTVDISDSDGMQESMCNLWCCTFMAHVFSFPCFRNFSQTVHNVACSGRTLADTALSSIYRWTDFELAGWCVWGGICTWSTCSKMGPSGASPAAHKITYAIISLQISCIVDIRIIKKLKVVCFFQLHLSLFKKSSLHFTQIYVRLKWI